MKSGLLVASSWISFVIPPDVIPGRMALLITLLLALVNLSGTVIDKRPSTKNTTILETRKNWRLRRHFCSLRLPSLQRLCPIIAMLILISGYQSYLMKICRCHALPSKTLFPWRWGWPQNFNQMSAEGVRKSFR